MISDGPKVRDFTDAARTLSLDIDSGSAYELVLSLFVFSSPDDYADYDIEPSWFEDLRRQASPDLLDRLGDLGGCGGIWLGLVGAVTDVPAPRTVDRFLEHLELMDPVELRALLFEGGAKCGGAVDAGVIPPIASGDLEGLDEALGGCDDATARTLRHLMSLPVDETSRHMTGIMREFAEIALPDRQRLAGILARDAAEKRALAESMPAEQLVELATSGITFARQPDVGTIMLVPSVVLRPWVVIWEYEGTRIFCYPVADEHMAADPNTPPSWMVDFYKALGDDKRLRILRLLAEAPLSLADLTERLDLSKSTIHHHVRLLRTAGLVRVTIGDEKTYSLRTDASIQAAKMLEAYLATTEPVS